MPRQTSPESAVTFYTIEPSETSLEYKDGNYVHVVGIATESKSVWLPSVGESRAKPVSLRLPLELAENAQEYFAKYYIEQTRKYQNCHIGAAAIMGAMDIPWDIALWEALQTVRRGEAVHPTALAIGRVGVVGGMHEDEPLAFHSMVGVAKNLGLQTDGENGPMSLASHTSNLVYYREHQFDDLQVYER